jgi:uncharacterized protein YehS (DUF1456 family)
MSKKWKIILTVVAAVVVLTVSGGMIAMADDETAPVSNPLLARVAQILGNNITEQTLTSAFKSARVEVAREAITVALDKAVTDGIITTTEKASIEAWLAQQPDPTNKDAMKTWWATRPQITKPELYRRFLGARRIILRYGWCHEFAGIEESVMKKVAVKLGVTEQALIDAFKQASQEMQTSKLQNALKNAVTNGRLTQAEASQIETWWAQRPAALDKFAPGFGGMGRGFCCPRFFRDK